MSFKKTCVIAQPTFLPWLGWFDLVDQADVLVILDDVAFSKQSWQQRNRIRTRNGLEFLTVPVKTAGRLGQRIADCELVNQSFVVKIIKTLQANYAKAPYFASNFDQFITTAEKSAMTGRLVDFNYSLISWMAEQLGLATPMILASTLGAAGHRGEHVAEICKSVGADHYLSPFGAADYLREDKRAFDLRSISVSLHSFEHPEYLQCFSPFIPFASTLDLIFNAGPASIDIIRLGRRPALPLVNSLELIKSHT